MVVITAGLNLNTFNTFPLPFTPLCLGAKGGQCFGDALAITEAKGGRITHITRGKAGELP